MSRKSRSSVPIWRPWATTSCDGCQSRLSRRCWGTHLDGLCSCLSLQYQFHYNLKAKQYWDGLTPGNDGCLRCRGEAWLVRPCARTSVRRSPARLRTACSRRRRPSAGCWREGWSCASRDPSPWKGIASLRRPHRTGKSRVKCFGRWWVSLGSLPAWGKRGNCIHRGCRDCAGRRRCRSSAACGHRRTCVRRRRWRQGCLLAWHTETGSWGKIPAGRCTPPSCCCWAGRKEPAFLRSRRESSEAWRFRRAARQRRSCSAAGCSPRRSAPGSSAVLPCCFWHREDNQTGWGCKADSPGSQRWRCWGPDGRLEESRMETEGEKKPMVMGSPCWRWSGTFLCCLLQNKTHGRMFSTQHLCKTGWPPWKTS